MSVTTASDVDFIAPADRAARAAKTRRSKLLTWLAAGVTAAAVAYGGYDLFFAGRSVETDNAYVGADSGQVTPLISGPVAQVLARETEIVKAGQPLVVLDDADQ